MQNQMLAKLECQVYPSIILTEKIKGKTLIIIFQLYLSN